jgi:threonine synthase
MSGEMSNLLRAALGEGNTPLVAASALAREVGLRRLYFKLESSNPTGSFKDRFARAAVGAMLDAGQRACVASSSGNTGSALAAYCARAGIACHLFVTEETPAEKILQARAYGARVYRVVGYGSDPRATAETDARLAAIASVRKVPFVVSAYRYCPDAMEGLGAISDELVVQLGDVPDHLFVPVGGGGLLTAVWRGFRRLHDAGRIPRLPRMHGVQPAGNPTVHRAWLAGSREVAPVVSTTRISGLIVPFDIDGSAALSAIYESGGRAFAISDEEIWGAQRLLAAGEGIYAEPAGSASVAGLREAARSGWIGAGESAVCLITGHGFKDVRSIDAAVAENPLRSVTCEGVAALDFDAAAASSR